MPRNFPPLNSLKAFEAAASLGNFSKAADELGVTQGAISKQIKTLEDYLGLSVFHRRHQTVEVTRPALKFLKVVNDSLANLEKATDDLKQRQTETLTISVLPTLSSRWLIPLLENYKAKNQNLKVKIKVDTKIPDFAVDNVDLAIQVAKKNQWRQLHVEKLMSEELLAVCSPKVIKKHPINQIADFTNHQLLEHTSRPMMWHDFLKAHKSKIPVTHKYSFEHFFMLIQAAIDGSGIALIPRILIQQELESGKLIIALKTKYQSPYNYYLICPRQQAESKKLRTFRKWLQLNNA